MIEIRFHGRGGQGTVIASELLAQAAFIEGKTPQSFPFFGVERRGAPVTAFTRIDDKPIQVRTSIMTPDIVVVLDPGLLRTINVTAGLKPNGLLLVNTAILGAFARTSGLVGLPSVLEAIAKFVPAKKDANRAAAEDAFDHVTQFEVIVR